MDVCQARSFLFFLTSVLLLPAVCQAELTRADQQVILDEHNDLRMNVMPTASNMEMMVFQAS